MAHVEQRNFCMKVRRMHPECFYNVNVLDVGSLDINGSNRYLFSGVNAVYTGIDVALGRNVDAMAKGHEWSAPDNFYDTIISTECFEHDMYYELTLKNIMRMLKPEGMFIFTCATTGREEHGTTRCHAFTSPLTSRIAGWSDYYKNLTASDILKVLNIEDFKEVLFEVNSSSYDLYFYGIKNPK
jgi:hypothetical protein